MPVDDIKLFRNLNREDLATNPIWDWVSEESSATSHGESCVRPVADKFISRRPFHQYLVAAAVSLKSGDELPGCVEVTVHGTCVHCVPLFVFLLDRQLDMAAHETDRLLSRYTRCAGNRPIKWRLLPLIENESKVRQGSVTRSLIYMLGRLVFHVAMRRRQQ